MKTQPTLKECKLLVTKCQLIRISLNATWNWIVTFEKSTTAKWQMVYNLCSFYCVQIQQTTSESSTDRTDERNIYITKQQWYDNWNSLTSHTADNIAIYKPTLTKRFTAFQSNISNRRRRWHLFNGHNRRQGLFIRTSLKMTYNCIFTFEVFTT